VAPLNRLTGRAARALGAAARAAYAAALPAIVRRPPPVTRTLPCRVYAFSSEHDLPEQVASLRSLLTCAGRPRGVTVVSDGSHGSAARELLRAVDPCVEIVDLAQVLRPDLPASVLRYAAARPMGAKLAVELSLPENEPVLYVDADVLFFPGASALGAELATARSPRYLVDAEPYLDRRLLAGLDPTDPPVNGGLLALSGGLRWQDALERFERLSGEPVFHTEQTLVHLSMHATDAQPLDPHRYVVETDDMYAFGDAHASPALAARHYTSPVRHKLWLTLATTAGLRALRRTAPTPRRPSRRTHPHARGGDPLRPARAPVSVRRAGR
jgi:hypothetical protein